MPHSAQPDELVSLDQARTNLIPRRSDGDPVNATTVWRWIHRGLAGADGERIRLQVCYAGHRPLVTAEAIDRFFAAVTAAKLARHRDTADPRPPATATPNAERSQVTLPDYRPSDPHTTASRQRRSR